MRAIWISLLTVMLAVAQVATAPAPGDCCCTIGAATTSAAEPAEPWTADGSGDTCCCCPDEDGGHEAPVPEPVDDCGCHADPVPHAPPEPGWSPPISSSVVALLPVAASVPVIPVRAAVRRIPGYQPHGPPGRARYLVLCAFLI